MEMVTFCQQPLRNSALSPTADSIISQIFHRTQPKGTFCPANISFIWTFPTGFLKACKIAQRLSKNLWAFLSAFQFPFSIA
jgi:hypothetical protein